MPGKARQKPVEQRGAIFFASEPIVQARGLAKSIANLPQVTGASATRDNPAKRAANVRERAQGIAQIGPFYRAIMPELYQRQPLFDPILIEQWGGKVLS